MKRVLITGGAGFIGSSLAGKLSENPDFEITIVDNLLTGDTKKIPQKDNVQFIKADVNNYEAMNSIFNVKGFDYVFHYAAVVGVQRTLENPIMVLDDIKGIENVLKLSKNTGVKRVYFSSSSEVYGEPVEFPQNEETTPLNSKLPYAIVKNIGEAFFRSYEREYGLPYTIFRFFNTYGPKQSKDFVISKFIASALKNDDITIYGDGSQTRTFCFVDDNVDACLTTLFENKNINDTLNIGSDVEISILDLAQKIIAITGSSSKIVHLPALKEGDMTRRHPDITKMRKLLNRELLPVEKGIEKILENTSYIL
jgi:UDP-glucose 4-epimerase